MGNEGFQFVVEAREFGVRGDGVEGGMIAVVALVFPYVN